MSDDNVTYMASRKKWSDDVSPAEALRLAAQEVEDGTAPCGGLLILGWHDDPNDKRTVFRYAAGVDHRDEVAMLGVFQEMAIHDWFES